MNMIYLNWPIHKKISSTQIKLSLQIDSPCHRCQAVERALIGHYFCNVDVGFHSSGTSISKLSCLPLISEPYVYTWPSTLLTLTGAVLEITLII